MKSRRIDRRSKPKIQVYLRKSEEPLLASDRARHGPVEWHNDVANTQRSLGDGGIVVAFSLGPETFNCHVDCCMFARSVNSCQQSSKLLD